MESKELVPKTPKRTRRTSAVEDPESNPLEVEEKISALKTPRRTRRTSVLYSESLEQEECVAALKTPKRTRRTSVLETQPVLAELPEQEESDGSSLPKIDPVTPGRSTFVFDPRTPSRCEALSQTPRRSCRKSIKPIQEYENIVAQKGLSAKAKRLIIESTASDDVVDEVAPLIIVEERETKWTAADIGRVSSKRSKKKSKKNKKLQRQKNVETEEENEEAKHLNGQQSSVESHDGEKDDTEMVVEEKENNQIEDDKKDVEEINVEEPDIAESKEEQDTVAVEESGVETSPPKTSPTPVEVRNDEELVSQDDQQVENEIPSSDATQATEEISPAVLQIEDDHNSVESDDSMDEGDIILNALPVTGDDDIMQSPEKSRQSNPKMSLLATPMTEPANKSDDSDCIMLSLSESSQSRQSISQRPPSTTGEFKFDANESSDSLAVNMPPLVVCSDDEEEDNEEFVDALKSPVRSEEDAKEPDSTNNADEPLDRTFETNEKKDNSQPSSVKKAEQLISPNEDRKKEEEGGKIIEILMSPEEIKKIVVGGIEEKTNDNDSKPSSTEADEDVEMVPLDGTFDADDRPSIEINAVQATPKSVDSRSSITRLPTPFKTDKSVMPDIFVEDEDDDLEETFEVIIVPVENPLKSSRKRSFSFCGADRPKKNVTFHSPSNITMNIYDGDLMKNATKHTPTNITKRRKRSLSVTETERDLMDYIQQKKPTGATPQKKTVHQSRIRMPNFSNIHQKQFQKMESISDHVARRAERAKNLINSSTKIKPASVQKGIPVKKSILQDHNKDGTKTQLPKPKARQRIDMSGPENKSTTDQTTNPNPTGLLKNRPKTKQDNLLSDDLAPLTTKTPTKLNANIFKQNDGNKLTKPRLNFNATTVSSSCGNMTFSAAVPQRMHLPNPRECFNLSTNIHSSTTTSSLAAPKPNKLEDRRKRMMEMFKSKTTNRVGENKKEILKGVRTNRRFELQMMCRNNRQN